MNIQLESAFAVERAVEATDISAFEDASERDLRREQFALKDKGDYDEIVSTIFAQTGGKVKNKPMLDALISIGKNRFDWNTGKAQWFKTSQQTLTTYFMENDPNFDAIQLQSQKRKIKRHIDRLIENQEQAGVTWVEYREGGKRKYESSEFRLVILEHAVEARLRVKSNPLLYTPSGPGSKWKNASLEVASEFRCRNSTKAKPKKAKGTQTLEQMRNAIIGYFKKFRATRRTQGCDDNFIRRELDNLIDRAMRCEQM